MPNGFPYFLRFSEDFCPNCGLPLCDHDREREHHGGGRWSYNYICPSGSPYRLHRPGSREGSA